jgi:hypothetical protein
VPVVARRRVAGRGPLPWCARRSPPGCRRRRRARRSPTAPRSPPAWASACADWKYGPSSGAMPSQSSAVMIPSVHSVRLRSSSVSSMRRTNVPPCWRAKSQLKSAERALPDVEVARGRRGEPRPRWGRALSHGSSCAGAFCARVQGAGVSRPRRWRWRPSGSR